MRLKLRMLSTFLVSSTGEENKNESIQALASMSTSPIRALSRNTPTYMVNQK